MYSPRPCPATGVGGRDGLPELGGDDERLRSGGSVAGGEDRGDRGPKRPRRGAGGIAGASNCGDEAREECRWLHEPDPSLLCTMTTGKDAASVLVSCADSVSAVIAVWRLVLACMGGANGSSLAANTNPYSALLLEDDDDDDGDGGWAGGVAAPSWGLCAADDPALSCLLGDGGDGGCVGDLGALSWGCHVAHDPALPCLLRDGGDGGRVGDVGSLPWGCHVAHDPTPRLLEDDGDGVQA